MTFRPLTPEEERVIIHKGTEYPNTGEYTDFFGDGVYRCKQCGAELYRSSAKFHSGCGWPSFDDEIEGAVRRLPDCDGRRIEIVCASCGGHLGHVFEDGPKPTGLRYCTNGLALEFKPDED